MALGVGDVVGEVAGYVGGVLGAGRGIAADAAAQYIKEGTPDTLIPNIGVPIARKICRLYASNPGVVPGPAAAGYERICRPYLDDIGFGDGPAIELPFRGGQCSTVYLVSLRAEGPNGDNIEQFPRPAFGPIGGTRFNPETQQFQLFCRGINAGTTQCAPVAEGPADWRDVGLGGQGYVGGSIAITGVSRCDGLPDDCGNVPPDYKEPAPPPVPEPPRSPITIAPDIDIDVEVQIGPEGEISIDIGTGPIIIDPFGDGGDGGGDDGNPPGAPEPGPVVPGGNGGFGGDDELGEPPAGKRWVGVCMAITERPESFGTIPSQTVDKVYPEVVGNVRLICNAAGTEIVNTPVQIRSDRVCLWEPVRGLNPVAIRVNLKPGFGYAYQGYAQPVDN